MSLENEELDYDYVFSLSSDEEETSVEVVASTPEPPATPEDEEEEPFIDLDVSGSIYTEESIIKEQEYLEKKHRKEMSAQAKLAKLIREMSRPSVFARLGPAVPSSMAKSGRVAIVLDSPKDDPTKKKKGGSKNKKKQEK